MQAEIASTNNDFEDILSMLYNYVLELHDIDDSVKIRTEEELKEEYFLSESGDTIFYILRDNDSTPVGFAVLGVESNCHPLADVYINEFYIKPEYRKCGYGREFITEILDSMPIVRLCYYILPKNYIAVDFWDKVLKYDWSDVSNSYSDINNTNLLWYMWERRW